MQDASILGKSVNQTELNVFVHLARNKDAIKWLEDYKADRLIGINDETPYGYGRARHMGCKVIFSVEYSESVLEKIVRFGLRLLLGFDLIHAWRQRDEISRADVIWTHTESQYLAVAAVLILCKWNVRLIGQTVWLLDRWNSLNPLLRMLYSRLISRVNVMTFHSESNGRLAQLLFPKADVRIIPFGIPAEVMISPFVRRSRPIQILAIGNDRHRDWDTLIKATRNREEVTVKIISGTIKKRKLMHSKNIEICRPKTNTELVSYFQNATLLCVPLNANMHASGITVIQEAVLMGVPVIATDTGGLRLYFSNEEIAYVPIRDVSALQEAIMEIANNPLAAVQRACRAQARLGDARKFGAGAYILRHVEISREICLQEKR